MGTKKKKILRKKQRARTGNSLDEEFQLSRFTIRTKLMLLISGVIGLALFVMIQLVTYFYAKDMAANVQETNLKLASVIANSVETYITSMAQNGRMLADGLKRGRRDSLQSQAFATDPNLVMLAVVDRSLAIQGSIINPKFLNKQGLSASDLQAILPKYRKKFQASFSGRVVLVNVSPGFATPLLALSVPLGGGDSSSQIAILVSKMQSILTSFQSPGLAEVFMVNEAGEIVTHPNRSVTLAGKSLAGSPIVKNMQSSKFNSSQIRYTEEDGYYLAGFRKIPSVGLGVVATVKESKAFAGVYRIRRRNFYLMVTVICLAILIAFLFARQLVLPVKELTKAARQILLGNFRFRVTPRYRDEIGLLSDTFNKMSHGLEERENLKESFERFVNKEIAELSLGGGLGLGGERKECSIFFSDIRGFTAMSEKLRPEEVVEFLNEYFGAMVECVNENGGIVDKFIGDAIMAHWGAIKSTPNNAQSAIDAALDMRAALQKYNEGRGSKPKPAIRMGMGINTGSVIAGQIGSSERLDYTVIGDAVNLASRVESLTKHFGVDLLITDHAHAKVRGIFHTEAMHKIKVRGKSKPVTVYAVLGRKSDPDAPRSLEELRKLLGITHVPADTESKLLDA